MSLLRYWWRTSLARGFWNDLTPLGRWVLWLPLCLLFYLIIYPVAFFGMFLERVDDLGRGRRPWVHRLFWKDRRDWNV